MFVHGRERKKERLLTDFTSSDSVIYSICRLALLTKSLLTVHFKMKNQVLTGVRLLTVQRGFEGEKESWRGVKAYVYTSFVFANRVQP